MWRTGRRVVGPQESGGSACPPARSVSREGSALLRGGLQSGVSPPALTPHAHREVISSKKPCPWRQSPTLEARPTSGPAGELFGHGSFQTQTPRAGRAESRGSLRRGCLWAAALSASPSPCPGPFPRIPPGWPWAFLRPWSSLLLLLLSLALQRGNARPHPCLSQRVPWAGPPHPCTPHRALRSCSFTWAFEATLQVTGPSRAAARGSAPHRGQISDDKTSFSPAPNWKNPACGQRPGVPPELPRDNWLRTLSACLAGGLPLAPRK